MSAQFSACFAGFEIINLHIEQSGMVSNVLLFDFPRENRKNGSLAADFLKMRSLSIYLTYCTIKIQL